MRSDMLLNISKHCKDEMDLKTISFDITFKTPKKLHICLTLGLISMKSPNNLNKHSRTMLF